MYYVLWFLVPSNQMTRHLLPIYPIMLISATVIIYHLAIEMKQKWGHLLWKMSATICILIGLGIQSLFMINYVKFHFLQETRDSFYLRNVGQYNLVQWVNKSLTTSDRISNPIRYLNYLLEVPYIYLRNPKQLQIGTHSTSRSERIIEKLTGKIVTHVIGWNHIVDTMVKKHIYKAIRFDVVTYSSRTLGISEKYKSKIFLINNEIK